MKKYILVLMVLVLIIGCAPKKEVETAKPIETPKETQKEEVEMPSPPAEMPAAPAEKITKEEDNVIEIRDGSFSPVNKTIGKDTEIWWINKDKREHKIACYLEGTRVITSLNLKEGQLFMYTFLEEGEYTCIDAIYGLRGVITVRGKGLIDTTGGVVFEGNEKIEGASLAGIVIASIVVLLFLFYRRKAR